MKNFKWKWSDDSKCYYIAGLAGAPPKCYCLGERYVYAHYGLDSYGILYRGSTIDDWGGYHFGYDLKKAIEWVQGAAHPELKDTMWTLSGPRNHMNENLRSLLAYRQQGNTSALVGILKANKKAKIVVHSYRMGQELVKTHGISEEQIILVQNLTKSLEGCTGPVLVDIPAIPQLVELTAEPEVARE